MVSCLFEAGNYDEPAPGSCLGCLARCSAHDSNCARCSVFDRSFTFTQGMVTLTERPSNSQAADGRRGATAYTGTTTTWDAGRSYKADAGGPIPAYSMFGGLFTNLEHVPSCDSSTTAVVEEPLFIEAVLGIAAAKKAVVQRSAEELFGEGPAAGGGGEGGCCSGYLHGALGKWLAPLSNLLSTDTHYNVT